MCGTLCQHATEAHHALWKLYGVGGPRRGLVDCSELFPFSRLLCLGFLCLTDQSQNSPCESVKRFGLGGCFGTREKLPSSAHQT